MYLLCQFNRIIVAKYTPTFETKKGRSMATQQDLTREREMLTGLGVPPVKVCPPRCTWYNADGSGNGNLPCDPYSRLLYLGRGLRPDIGVISGVGTVSPVITVTLLDAVVSLVDEAGTVECTASELLELLQEVVDNLPQDAIRLSRRVVMK